MGSSQPTLRAAELVLSQDEIAKLEAISRPPLVYRPIDCRTPTLHY
jgi:hypothetical protein